MTMVAIMAAQASAQQQEAERALLDAFRIADATAESRAVSLGRLGIEPTEAFRALVAEGVVRSIGRDHYYLSEAAVIARRGRGSSTTHRQRVVILAVAIGLALLGVGLMVLIAMRAD